MTSLFIELRDQLAGLYDTPENARIVIDAAGLDATVIPFYAQARANWHAILTAAVKAAQVDDLLAAVQDDYSTNHDFQALYQRYVAFVANGGRLIPTSISNTHTTGTHASGDLIVATVGDNAQHVVIGKDIHIGGGAPQPSIREKELAYLNALVAKCADWAAKYTPLAGIAEVRAATIDGPRLDLPQLFMPPGFEKLVEHGFGEQRRVERVPVEDLRTAVRQYRRLVLLGEPGAGKTTTLWRLFYDYAVAALNDETAPLPLLVPLGGYTGTELPLHYCQQHFGHLGDQLTDYLRNKRVILLLDALNEMPRQNYRERVQRIERLLSEYPDLSVVVTCRVLDYVETLTLEKLDVKPLDVARQREYLHHYLGEQHGEALFWQLAGDEVAELWQEWCARKKTWEDFWYGQKLPKNLRRHLSSSQRELWQLLHEQLPPLLDLGRNPFLLVMLAQVYARQGTMPQNRGHLLAAFVETLLAREEKRCESERWPGPETLYRGLGHLAYAMQELGERSTAVDVTWANQQLAAVVPDPAEILYLASGATLLGPVDISF